MTILSRIDISEAHLSPQVKSFEFQKHIVINLYVNKRLII